MLDPVPILVHVIVTIIGGFLLLGMVGELINDYCKDIKK